MSQPLFEGLRSRLLGLVAIACLAASSVCAPVFAQTKLRVGDSLPLKHFFADNATRYWMEEVTRRTNGAVEFEYFPAGQLGKAKDMLALTQSGVLDIGYVVPTYVQDKMPLTAVAELPGTFSSSCAGTMAYWKLAHGEGALAKGEYAPNGVRVIFAIVMPPYQVFSARRVIGGLDDVAGMKLRTAGGAQDALIRKVEGVPIRMAAPELHEALSRGTVDGMVFPAASVLSYNIEGLVKSVIVGENFGSAVLTYMISENRWKSLPESIRLTMAEVGVETTRRICAFADRELEGNIARIGEKGARMVSLPEAERGRLRAAAATVRDEWARALEARGKPGAAVLRDFVDALK